MPKKPIKTSKTKKRQSQKSDACKPTLYHPSTWLIAILSIALIAVCCVSAYGFSKFNIKTNIDSAKLAVFDHIAESYIRDMDFTMNYDQSAITQITGYGVSDEDGVFYITFDFAPYPAEDVVVSSFDDLDLHHGILYFWQDAERGTYSHAFSYHDDDYHPGGTYYRFTE